MFLNLIFIFLFFGILLLLFIPKNNLKLLKILSLLISSCVFLLSTLIFILFKSNSSDFQYISNLDFFNFQLLNLNFDFAIDGISIYFFYLTTFLIFLCILFIWNENHFKLYSILLLFLEFLLLLTFSVLNLFLFYIFFECILIPIYLIMLFWGSREKKIRASYLLFFYTVCGSLLMLGSLMYIYSNYGNFSLEYLSFKGFSFDEQTFLWIAFFLSFASKIPMFPFHIWLPEAHVEAPTAGSVLLAGILLKLGVYGFLRYSLMLFPVASTYFSPILYVFGILGVVFASLAAITQTDLKRIIAYSSIAHMNLVTLGLFSGNSIGIESGIIQSVSHGFVASALFFLVGMLYSRYHSRLLTYYGGIVHIMPLFVSFFLFFTLSNIALPGTSSFIGEFLILLGVFQENIICAILAGFSVILSGAYSLWLYNRVVFGNFKSEFLKEYSDISIKEFFILISLFLPSLYMGLFPYKFIKVIHLAVIKLFIMSNVVFL